MVTSCAAPSARAMEPAAVSSRSAPRTRIFNASPEAPRGKPPWRASYSRIGTRAMVDRASMDPGRPKTPFSEDYAAWKNWNAEDFGKAGAEERLYYAREVFARSPKPAP